mmetsp:Transcript_6937/g.22843  ORF Transcript_6937/g.22843 Transcript_6937/m.22843 type:complete len:258 (-) Transcript_6937:10-783(-)
MNGIAAKPIKVGNNRSTSKPCAASWSNALTSALASAKFVVATTTRMNDPGQNTDASICHVTVSNATVTACLAWSSSPSAFFQRFKPLSTVSINTYVAATPYVAGTPQAGTHATNDSPTSFAYPMYRNALSRKMSNSFPSVSSSSSGSRLGKMPSAFSASVTARVTNDAVARAEDAPPNALTRPMRIVDAAIVVFIVTTEAARGTSAAAHLFVANIVDARATVRGTALDTVAIFILYRSCSQKSLARTSLVSNACAVI